MGEWPLPAPHLGRSPQRLLLASSIGPWCNSRAEQDWDAIPFFVPAAAGAPPGPAACVRYSRQAGEGGQKMVLCPQINVAEATVVCRA